MPLISKQVALIIELPVPFSISNSLTFMTEDGIEDVKKKIYKIIQANTGLSFQNYLRNEINKLLKNWEVKGEKSV